jgi:hypothetical protein
MVPRCVYSLTRGELEDPKLLPRENLHSSRRVRLKLVEVPCSDLSAYLRMLVLVFWTNRLQGSAGAMLC